MIDLVEFSAKMKPWEKKMGTTCCRNLNLRKYPRFKPKKTIYAFHCDFGKVVDIGMGGILFTYIYDKLNSSEETPSTGVLFFSCADNDNYIDSIPCTLVSDSAFPQPYLSNSCIIRQRRLAFGKLTSIQTEELERLILKSVAIPQFTATQPV